MKQIFYSKSLPIANIAAMVYAPVVDEQIVAETLRENGYETTETNTSSTDLKKNIVQHIDVIAKGPRGKFLIDVKTPTEKYVHLSKHFITSDTNKCTHIAIIYQDKVIIAKKSDIVKEAKLSHFTPDMYYVPITTFNKVQLFSLCLSDENSQYQKEQQAIYAQLKDTIDVENSYNMQKCIDCFQTAYKKYFNDTFEFVGV